MATQDKAVHEEAARLAAKFKDVKNRAKFARDFGVRGGDAMIYQHLNALRPMNLGHAQAYATGLGCTIEEISPRLAGEARTIASSLALPGVNIHTNQNAMSEGVKIVQEINLDENPDYPAIRRVNFKLSAGASGFGVEFRDEEGPPIVFQRSWYEKNGYNPGKLFAVRIANGSMEPGLYDGDVVVVNTESNLPKDGIVFAINYEGELVVKRIIRDAGQWWLSSDNPDQRRYPRKVCDENVFLIGEVVYKSSERI